MRVLSSPTPLSAESGWDSAGRGLVLRRRSDSEVLFCRPWAWRGRVNSLRFGPRGALWVATENGLSRIKNDHVTTLTSKNGIPCDTVHWSMDDTDHFVWVFTACGLVRIPRPELDAWVDDPSKLVQATLFDVSDGVRTHSYVSAVQNVTKASDGRIWYVAYDGVSVIDPPHVPFNKVPPPVHIEQVTADGKTYDAANVAPASTNPQSRD